MLSLCFISKGRALKQAPPRSLMNYWASVGKKGVYVHVLSIGGVLMKLSFEP